MNKATYFLISKNHRDTMLKAMQKQPSWSYILHFIIYFPHFSFSAISQACIHVRRKLVLLDNHSISQTLLQVFKQLRNHSLILNSYGIIHSFVAFTCWWSMLLCPGLPVNWFLNLFSSVELFLISETEI